MQKRSKYRVSVFFFILFMALLSAPSIIASVDDSIDTTCFFSVNEEEDQLSFKLLFNKNEEVSDTVFENQSNEHLGEYTFKQYPKPHLNLISPPPDYIS